MQLKQYKDILTARFVCGKCRYTKKLISKRTRMKGIAFDNLGDVPLSHAAKLLAALKENQYN